MLQTKAVATRHSNRVFAVKCHPTEHHTVYSAGLFVVVAVCFLVFFGPKLNIKHTGWDNTVQVWDLRAHRPVCTSVISISANLQKKFHPVPQVHHLSGPFVCGEALDVDVPKNQLLVGSYREASNLQVVCTTKVIYSKVTMFGSFSPGWGRRLTSRRARL
jgi:hypothetical protein